MKFQKETTINAPPDAVFAYIADISRHPEWGTFKMSVEKASDGAIGVGTRYKHVGRQMGAESRDEVVVTEYEPPQRLVYESDNKDGHFRHTFELSADQAGTHVSKTFDLQKTGFLMKLFTPVILVLAPRQQCRDLERIKARIEQSAAASSDLAS
jgi:uncharacterized protein YndB with AHSA1/START domain